MILTVNEISGFSCLDPLIKVYKRNNGELFYIYNNKKNKCVKFNLPVGVYFTENNLNELKKPVNYKKIILPPKERDLKKPENINVNYVDNPNKCTIFLSSGEIFLDNSFKNFPSFVRLYVLFHEIGHYHYNTEKFCDLFAAKNMLERGYNPSQIYFASKFSLSRLGEDRKNYCLNNMKKIK